MWKSLMFWTIAYPDFVDNYLSFCVAYIESQPANLYSVFTQMFQPQGKYNVNRKWQDYVYIQCEYKST